MHLPLFLRLYESLWKGFESDQRPSVNIGGCQIRLPVWRVVIRRSSFVSNIVNY